MIGAIILLFVLFGLNQVFFSNVKRRHRFVNLNLLNNLFWFHSLFWLIYYLYTLANRSDSKSYFLRSSNFTVLEWIEKYGAGTTFLEFASYPFSGILQFNYEMTMLMFAYMGYWGFVFFYIFYKENIKLTHRIKGYDIISVLMFLPNMHFWTASLGKGSIIFLGLGIATYGLSRISKRKLTLILGLALVYHVRPHVFLFMVLGIVIGFFTGRQKTPMYQKVLVIGGSILALVLLYDKILSFVGVDSNDALESFEAMSSHRASELAKAGSGVDTSNYPLFLKLFTFWFRPLFFDAPGVLGIFVSAENLLYLVITAKLFDKKFLPFFFKGSSLLKASAVIFITSSIALSTTMSNLGIIIRQKSMVMYFFFFVILEFLEYKRAMVVEQKKRRLAKLQQREINEPKSNSDISRIQEAK